MATLKTIADEAGVSAETVSRVLRGRYRGTQARGRERAEQVRAIAERLGYRVDAAARSMKSGRTMHVGLMVVTDPGSHLAPAIAAEALLGADEVLRPAGYVLSVTPVDRPDGEGGGGAGSRALRENALDGLIVLDDLPADYRPIVEGLARPTVYVNTDRWADADCVRRDEVAAGSLAVGELAALGYRRVAYLDRDAAQGGHFSFADRWAGASARAAAEGVSLRRVRTPLRKDVPLSPDLFDAAAPAGGPPVAVLVADTFLARRALAELSMRGLAAGRDYAMACCDDSDELGETLPMLARVRFDRYEMGRLAGRMVLAKLADPASGVPSASMGVSWVPGAPATTAPPAASLSRGSQPITSATFPPVA